MEAFPDNVVVFYLSSISEYFRMVCAFHLNLMLLLDKVLFGLMTDCDCNRQATANSCVSGR